MTWKSLARVYCLAITSTIIIVDFTYTHVERKKNLKWPNLSSITLFFNIQYNYATRHAMNNAVLALCSFTSFILISCNICIWKKRSIRYMNWYKKRKKPKLYWEYYKKRGLLRFMGIRDLICIWDVLCALVSSVYSTVIKRARTELNDRIPALHTRRDGTHSWWNVHA
jgi:hypothetical protein